MWNSFNPIEYINNSCLDPAYSDIRLTRGIDIECYPISFPTDGYIPKKKITLESRKLDISNSLHLRLLAVKVS